MLKRRTHSREWTPKGDVHYASVLQLHQTELLIASSDRKRAALGSLERSLPSTTSNEVFDIRLRLLEAFRDSSVAIVSGEVLKTILCHLYSMLPR
jgi:hypothetical protein